MLETLYNAVRWMNCFSHKNVMHATLSLCSIVTGSHIDYQKQCKPLEARIMTCVIEAKEVI